MGNGTCGYLTKSRLNSCLPEVLGADDAQGACRRALEHDEGVLRCMKPMASRHSGSSSAAAVVVLGEVRHQLQHVQQQPLVRLVRAQCFADTAPRRTRWRPGRLSTVTLMSAPAAAASIPAGARSTSRRAAARRRKSPQPFAAWHAHQRRTDVRRLLASRREAIHRVARCSAPRHRLPGLQQRPGARMVTHQDERSARARAARARAMRQRRLGRSARARPGSCVRPADALRA